MLLTQVVVGRTEDVDVCIPSDMISRRHAIFKKGEDGVWTVTDNKVSVHIFTVRNQILEGVAYH